MKTSPFRIAGPARIGFSGGRTSGYLLYRIMDAHNGKLPPDVLVTFANTGLELEETLEFVRECQLRWSAPIRWVEYRPTKPFFAEVDFYSASRRGEPFEQMIRKERWMPNPSARTCTKNLKIKTQGRFAKASGLKKWTAVIGIRADEPARVAKNRASDPRGYGCVDLSMPLVDAGVTKADVLKFWREHPFDLRLGTNESNCDVCFLIGTEQRVERIRKRPERAEWWIRMERERGMPFRRNSPSYEALAAYARDQQRIHLPVISNDDDLGGCMCQEAA